MLNCTDLACVLHHHHFYAHLHQLKHHLQDDNDNTVLGDGSHLDNNDNTQATGNDTDAELSLHVDAPNDVIYMVCGVVIAMLLVGVIIILVAVTINKLRKREDSSAPAIEAQQPSFGLPPSRGSAALVQQQQQRPTTEQQQIFATAASAGGIAVTVTTTTTTTAIDCNSNVGNNNNYNHLNNLNNHYNNNNINNNINAQTAVSEQEQIIFTRTSGGSCNGWVFPPKAPTPNIYHCMNTDLLQSDNDKNGFKGFRKQFSGRFKRLVTKKTVAPPAVIPPELKPQLKTIYVY